MATLPNDIARCPGIGSEEEGWWDDCQDCARRICPPIDLERAARMEPPLFLTHWCPDYLDMPE